MKILLCPDSFKDCMSASEVCDNMADGLLHILPNAQINKLPLADGGEGFVETILASTDGKLVSLEVSNPIGNKAIASYAIIDNGATAVIEMAQASGLELLQTEERNPLLTTTYGVGELIKNALEHKVTKIIIGLGGSATNDGGAGMLQALGARLTDHHGNEIKPGGVNLNNLQHIDLTSLDQRLVNTEIIIACDVNNPLIGNNGASYIFAAQKGATCEMIVQLESALRNYAQVVLEDCGISISNIAGSGAAGGLSAGLLLINGKIQSGIEIVAKLCQLEEKIIASDLVFSGEGAIDEQTAYGKTISGIAQLCKKHNKPLIIICGKMGGNLQELYHKGVSAIFSISNGFASKEEAFSAAAENIKINMQNIVRTIILLKRQARKKYL
jgi:glycerate kinase